MSLGNEIFEWRKQMVEQLLLQGMDCNIWEDKIKQAEKLIFGDCPVGIKLKCPARHVHELKAILNEFSNKNGYTVDITERW